MSLPIVHRNSRLCSAHDRSSPALLAISSRPKSETSNTLCAVPFLSKTLCCLYHRHPLCKCTCSASSPSPSRSSPCAPELQTAQTLSACASHSHRMMTLGRNIIYYGHIFLLRVLKMFIIKNDSIGKIIKKSIMTKLMAVAAVCMFNQATVGSHPMERMIPLLSWQ